MESNDQESREGTADGSPPRKGEKRPKMGRAEQTWQRRLLPLMIGMLVALTAFFFVASFVQLYYLQTRIERAPQLDLSPALSSLDEFEKELKTGAVSDEVRYHARLDYAKWKTLAMLEANTLQRRYHQAGVLLISRIWTRYLGFVTGTILALVGAAFILGKLREASSTLGGESKLWKLSMTSTSPGLILAVLGTALMLATLATNLDMYVNDGAIYVGQPAPARVEAPPPLIEDGSQQQQPSDAELLKRLKSEGASKK